MQNKPSTANGKESGQKGGGGESIQWGKKSLKIKKIIPLL